MRFDSPLRAALVLAGLSLVHASGCGSSSTQADGAGGSGGGTASTGGGPGMDAGTSGFGGAVFGCQGDGECGLGQMCSAARVCVPLGGCGANEDCAPGELCSGTQSCIPMGTCAADVDCGMGFLCDTASGTCAPGGGCGAEEFQTEAVAPNMLLVLDRSCSMTNGTPATKWELAVDAINSLTTTFSGQIRFGLTLFPDTENPNCDQGAPAVFVGPGNEMAIQAILTAALVRADPNFPKGPCITNITSAMTQASMEPAFNDATRPNYAVLITDGKQFGCMQNGGDAMTTQVIGNMLSVGVSTYVVGFGSGVDPAQLNIFADAGGVPRNDPTTRYYQADDAVTLQMALDTIATTSIGCTLALGEAPPNGDELFVFFEDQPLSRDPSHMEGWDFDPSTNQVTFYGMACDALKSGMVADVDVVFGCNVPTPM